MSNTSKCSKYLWTYLDNMIILHQGGISTNGCLVVSKFPYNTTILWNNFTNEIRKYVKQQGTRYMRTPYYLFRCQLSMYGYGMVSLF